MWLVTTSIAAAGATLGKFAIPRYYKLGFLSLMLWGGGGRQ